ncbi:fumarate reductase/succinate dehydrogenase flavoprotein domain-containing protein [Myxococcus stipitatus DSM 14675]|uniref:3-oxosteroid 1-dehydrogenase n=1 Tax=Myxococcus stipitatus (strain DSM 14675 / JCM 12634 / Mx s8) TaxID=1278073 RepID=L7UAZ9_MYXSD|nr:FAD-dependent oxidoreductase [Myxococcus stipitatus]AGC46081.1 fumarate reductase/succinate dehydrogenase flavoprotein domain-containing protein [Myxococcus stipitatus DSM 14675]
MDTRADGTPEVDVLVVGSGAGAMTAAARAAHQGAKVLLIEKSARYGGSSAMSGGCVWIPNNRFMKPAGIEDSDAEALRYLRALTKGRIAEERLGACVSEGRAMVDFLQDHSDVAMGIIPAYPDYYPEVPGGKSSGRSLEALPFHGSELGADFYDMRESHPQMLFLDEISLSFPESRHAMHRRPGWVGLMMRTMARYWLDVKGRLRGRRDRRVCLGAALVARLRGTLAKQGVPLWLNTGFKDFVVEQGRVMGVVASRGGQTCRILARQGVILAAGGFERNAAMREKYLPAPTKTEWSTGNPENTGDVISAGMDLGAATDFMEDAWWGPTNPIPGRRAGVAYMFVTERSVPGGILVNRDGVRVVNESAPYSDIVRAMYATPDREGRPSVPLYLVVDAAFRRRFSLGPIMPGVPDAKVPKHLFEQRFLVRGSSLDDLAAQVGIRADGLRETAEKMNRYAREGKDPDFHRGDSLYDACWSDASYGRNPCLGTLMEPPFYAVEVYPGDIGSRGGLRVDAHARVLRPDQDVIPGLYAIGNCSSPVYGNSYPGAGATLGPAMTFGYVAANRALAGGA